MRAALAALGMMLLSGCGPIGERFSFSMTMIGADAVGAAPGRAWLAIADTTAVPLTCAELREKISHNEIPTGGLLYAETNGGDPEDDAGPTAFTEVQGGMQWIFGVIDDCESKMGNGCPFEGVIGTWGYASGAESCVFACGAGVEAVDRELHVTGARFEPMDCWDPAAGWR